MSNAEDSQVLVGVQELTRIYHHDGQKVFALRGVNMELRRGVFAAVKGRSGSGKTTLLNLIGGLDRPTSGSINFDGKALADLTDRELTLLRRHQIGFIFQSFALLPTYSAFENVELMLRLKGIERHAQEEQARRCLQLVGLEKWLYHRPNEMSGGQQQRVAIARALAAKPALILADEPTGELDTETSRLIYALLQKIVKKDGVTVLLSTHDPLIDEFIDMKFQLEDGKMRSE